MAEQALEIALSAVTEAAALCQAVRRELVDTPAIRKADESPVTVADFGSQALICRRICEAYPNDEIVAEEDAADLSKPEYRSVLDAVCEHVRRFGYDASEKDVRGWIDCGNGKVSGRYWTVDPIDGTKGFLRNDQYAVALALVEDGQVVTAALACPALSSSEGKGITFLAERGGVAEQVGVAGDRTAVSVADDGGILRLVESVEPSHGNPDLQAAVASAVAITEPSLRMDSQAKYAAVARGEASLYLRLPSNGSLAYAEKIWDHAAGSLIVEEAGGTVTDMYGAPLDFGTDERMYKNQGVIASNGEIHDAVVDALAAIVDSSA